MAGIIGVGRHYQDQATQGMQAAGQMKDARHEAGKQLKSQHRATTMSAVGTGAGMGFAMGGPVGAGIGAAIGLLGSQLF